MANTMIGKISVISEIQEIPTKRGDVLTKRTLVLDCTQYDRYTGKPIENFPQIEFIGQKCEILNSFNVGDIVEVHFYVSGRKIEKDGKYSYFNSVIGYKVSNYTNSNPQSNVVTEQPHTHESKEVEQQQATTKSNEKEEELPF